MAVSVYYREILNPTNKISPFFCSISAVKVSMKLFKILQFCCLKTLNFSWKRINEFQLICFYLLH